MQAGAFCSPEWFSAWVEAFGDDPSAIRWADGLPLLKAKAAVGLMTVDRLRAPANEHTPWLELPSGTGADAVRQWCRDHGADTVVLPLLRREPAALRQAPPSLLVRWQQAERAPFVDCAGSWEAYWQSRSSKSRSDWGRAERRLCEQGGVLACHSSEEGLDAALDVAFEIEADGWKGEQGSAIRQDPKLERFYRRAARDWARRGLLRLYFLEEGERRIAFQLCALDGRQLVSLKIGFRRAFARQGPGQALQLMILRELFADPEVDRFDMLGPATEHKMKWATGVEPLWTVRCYRPSLRGGVAALRWSVLPALRGRLRRERAPQRVAEAG